MLFLLICQTQQEEVVVLVYSPVDTDIFSDYETAPIPILTIKAQYFTAMQQSATFSTFSEPGYKEKILIGSEIGLKSHYGSLSLGSCFRRGHQFVAMTAGHIAKDVLEDADLSFTSFASSKENVIRAIKEKISREVVLQPSLVIVEAAIAESPHRGAASADKQNFFKLGTLDDIIFNSAVGTYYFDVGLILLDSTKLRVNDFITSHNSFEFQDHQRHKIVGSIVGSKQIQELGSSAEIHVIGWLNMKTQGRLISEKALTIMYPYADGRPYEMCKGIICGIFPPMGQYQFTLDGDSGAAVLVRSTHDPNEFYFIGIVHGYLMPQHSLCTRRNVDEADLQCVSLFTPADAILQKWPDLILDLF